MSLHFQDPEDPTAPRLLEHLLDACEGALSGGGAFAWATADGANLLLRDPVFKAFLGRGSFDLVIGVDAVTNEPALRALKELAVEHPSLKVSVLLHSRARTLFHPKVAWFRGERAGTLVAGSGNLTVAGLQANWEAFTVTSHSSAEAKHLASWWDQWRVAHNGVLRPVDDPQVLEEARKNKRWSSRRRTATGDAPEESVTIEADGASEADANSPVLVAEIPKAGTRWKQANFDQDNYVHFFGAIVGSQRRITLRSVGNDGVLGPLESRPSVEVASQNYRFELAAAGNLAYPAGGPPIGVFIKQPNGVFLYRIVLPGEAGYDGFSAFLAEYWTGAARFMRRVRGRLADLRPFVPTDPIFLAAGADA